MKSAKETATIKDEAAPARQPPKVNHAERIRVQVLAKIGRPPRLDRVEVSWHNGSKYRVNIWQQPESDKTIAVTISPRIGLSYYLTVSETGEIIHSSPPLTRLHSSA